MALTNLALDMGNFNIGHWQQCPTPNAQCLTDLWERLQSLDAQLLNLLLGQFPADQPATPFAVQLYHALISGTGLETAPISGQKFDIDGGLPRTAVASGFIPDSRLKQPSPTPAIGRLTSEAALAAGSFVSPNNGVPTIALPSAPLNAHPTIGQSPFANLHSPIAAVIVQTARRYGVDPALALAVAKAESNFDPDAISPKGAIGVMQLMPETAKALGVRNPFDPAQNIDGGIRYLRQLIDRFGGRMELAVAAYNAGPNAVLRYGGVPPYPETQSFERSVLSYWKQFKQQFSTRAEHASPFPEDLPISFNRYNTTFEGNQSVATTKSVVRDGVSRDLNVHQPKGISNPTTPANLLPPSQPAVPFGASSEGSLTPTNVEAHLDTPHPPLSTQNSELSTPHSNPVTVHRLIAEIPTPDEAEPLRLRLTVHTKPDETAFVQIAVRTSDERLAALLQTEVPSLRQQLWLHGIALAQFTVSDSARDGGQRDPTQSERPARRLSSAPRAARPLLSLDTDDGVWA